MKRLFLSALIVLVTFSAQAQFNYQFSYYTQPYTPLVSGISVNDTTIWDEELYKIPIGFNFDMDGISIDTLSLIGGIIAATDTMGIINGFVMIGADLVDRGHIGDTQTVSPIRYELTGTTPNRIFKLEVFNAGFYDEYFADTTADDSINIQLWLYEGSNVVELHYGDARVDSFNWYFTYDSSAVFAGYLRGLDVDNGDIDKYYFVEGNPVAPTIDSSSDINDLAELGLDTIPPSGMVYRFGPIPASVKDLKQALISVKVFPTIAHADLFIEHGEKALSYNIVSMNGTMVSGGSMNAGKNWVDISRLPAGPYTIRLRSKNGERAVQFLKM